MTSLSKIPAEGKTPPPFGYLALTNIDPTQWCCAIEGWKKTIGRGKNADIRVSPTFPCVSRLHAAVWSSGDKAFLQDLGSTSGTSINGIWIEKNRDVLIAVGDRILMGDMEMYVADQLPTLARVIAARSTLMDDAEKTDDHGAKLRDEALLTSLTQAELEIILWVGRGYIDDQELAQVLHRSPHTIRTHMRNIFQKMGIHARTEILSWLRRKA